MEMKLFWEIMTAFLLSISAANADSIYNMKSSKKENIETKIEIADAQSYLDDVKIFPGKLTEAQADSLRLCDKLERRMGNALEYKVGLTNDLRKKPFDSNLDFYVRGEKKYVYLRGERLPESLRILISVGKDNRHEKVGLGDLEVYLIHSEKTRFEIKQASVFMNRKENTVLYTNLEKNYADAEGEFVVKQANGLITQILKDFGVISKTLMKQIGEALVRRNFQIWAEEIDRVTEIGNEMVGDRVYVYPLGLEKIRNKLLSEREEKLREIIVNAGEKKILGVVVYYSLKKPHKYFPNLFDDVSKMEYEAFKIYPLDIPLNKIIGRNY